MMIWIRKSNLIILCLLGNYGKAFAYASNQLGLINCTVAMPDTAPQNRRDLIRSFGVNVEPVPSSNLSMHVKKVKPDNKKGKWNV